MTTLNLRRVLSPTRVGMLFCVGCLMATFYASGRRGGRQPVLRGQRQFSRRGTTPTEERVAGGIGGNKDTDAVSRRASGNVMQRESASQKVNLDAPDGFLWLPVSMGSPECEPGARCDVTLRFCQIHIRAYQDRPWKFPMIPMLMKKSVCTGDRMRNFMLSDVREYVAEHPSEFLQPTGFVYHETRTGSTLVANMLAHVPTNLVSSENRVPEEPLHKCKQCTKEQQVQLLQEIMLIMGRATGGHTHSFFKFQDATSIEMMSKAFPDVPWMYLFRDPVEVMVSNLKGAYGKRQRLYGRFNFDDTTELAIESRISVGDFSFIALYDVLRASFAATASSVPEEAKKVAAPCLGEIGKDSSYSGSLQEAFTSREEKCAARLAQLCTAAVEGLERTPTRGMVVEYPNLPGVMLKYVYGTHFGMGEDLLKDHMPYLEGAARMYSKSMAKPETEFMMGSDKRYKEVLATEDYKNAAEKAGLGEIYRSLTRLQKW